MYFPSTLRGYWLMHTSIFAPFGPWNRVQWATLTRTARIQILDSIILLHVFIFLWPLISPMTSKYDDLVLFETWETTLLSFSVQQNPPISLHWYKIATVLVALTKICKMNANLLACTKEIGYVIARFWCPGTGTVKYVLSITNIIKCLYHFLYGLPWN